MYQLNQNDVLYQEYLDDIIHQDMYENTNKTKKILEYNGNNCSSSK